METHALRLHLRAGLRQYEIRRAIWAAERVFSAIEALDELPEACLEEVRDWCAEYARGRKDPMGDFKRAWVALVAEHIDDMRKRNVRLRRGLTGINNEEQKPPKGP